MNNQNDDILTALTLLYNVARQLDQNGQGASSIGVTNCNGEDLIKYNLLNILLYACSCSNENDIDMSVISDLVGFDVSYQDCLAAVSSSGFDSSILSSLPLSVMMLINADNAKGVVLDGNSGEENSYAYTLMLLYQLAIARLYKDCPFEALNQKNNALYNFLLKLNNSIRDGLKSRMHFNPNTGSIDAPNYSINPLTGEVQISRKRSSSSRSGGRGVSSAPSSSPSRSTSGRAEPPPRRQNQNSPTFFGRVCRYLKSFFE